MSDAPLVTPLDPQTLDAEKTPVMNQSSQSAPVKLLVWFCLVILLGTATGYFLSSGKKGSQGSDTLAAGKDIVQSATEVGSKDTLTFRDTAQGTIEAGGLGSEGTHKLIRPGGASQTVYLISSIVDLDSFVGKKVELWGESLKAQKVGWLMDVGRIKILE